MRPDLPSVGSLNTGKAWMAGVWDGGHERGGGERGMRTWRWMLIADGQVKAEGQTTGREREERGRKRGRERGGKDQTDSIKPQTTWVHRPPSLGPQTTWVHRPPGSTDHLGPQTTFTGSTDPLSPQTTFTGSTDPLSPQTTWVHRPPESTDHLHWVHRPPESTDHLSPQTTFTGSTDPLSPQTTWVHRPPEFTDPLSPQTTWVHRPPSLAEWSLWQQQEQRQSAVRLWEPRCMEDGGRRTEDGGRRTEDGGLTASSGCHRDCPPMGAGERILLDRDGILEANDLICSPSTPEVGAGELRLSLWGSARALHALRVTGSWRYANELLRRRRPRS
ncbi:hypothetical protein EYF80_056068 [Liparis tanakae]|uniref:Uncharacterized protein n=1 Tax=Liparis tanakae TaxID=230148 RepID=A0A4Z2EXS8_9TELE|nr:hypothetical protein EYF80_056068 [Liparis tanakae]